MKRRLASLFRWLEDHLDPSRRHQLEAAHQGSGKNVELLVELAKLKREAAPIPIPEHAPDWLPEHMVALKTFLFSPAGQVLVLRARAVQFELNTAACKDVFHTSHSAGTAKGFGDCLTWLTSLSRASRVPDAAPEGDTKPETDTTPIGESELRESMSP